jgi:transcriptional regulator with XRE-family HTH domain
VRRTHAHVKHHVRLTHKKIWGTVRPMKLKDWMEWRGLNDEQVAKLVKVDRSTISRIRRGELMPSWGLAARFHEVTDESVSANDFMPQAAE